jgi:predicted dehydrogenase
MAEISGGGELIDPGPHLIDLSRWFLGEFTEMEGWAETYFWKMPVDDNGFMLLKTKQNQTPFLFVSCTEWKNLFSLKIYGKVGKLDPNGLSGSYGVRRVTWYKMPPEMGPPETSSWEYPMGDDSWSVETTAFLGDLKASRPDSCGLEDAIAALRIVEAIYKRSGYDHCA